MDKKCYTCKWRWPPVKGKSGDYRLCRNPLSVAGDTIGGFKRVKPTGTCEHWMADYDAKGGEDANAEG